MITKPTLLIDKKRCLRNIDKMVEKASRNQNKLRPHFKTHQSLEIGRWFKEFGVDRITVSSADMAIYFSTEWDDITIAFPVNILEIDAVNALADKINLSVLIESAQVAQFLAKHLNAAVNVYLKIDVGTHRTGIDPRDQITIDETLDVIDDSTFLNFQGFLSHAGHTYHCQSFDEIREIHEESIRILSTLKNNYLSRYPELIISVGDTPGCSIMEDFALVDEMRPGNFVFYDLMQYQIGACTVDEIAVVVACPIVAKHTDRNELVIYGGGIHFSKERIAYLEEHDIYGHVVSKKGESWGSPIPDMYIKSLSQEHGIVSVPEEQMNKYNIGDLLYVLPVHSCMTMNLMRDFIIV